MGGAAEKFSGSSGGEGGTLGGGREVLGLGGVPKKNIQVQLGPRYEGQLNPMAEPIPHEVRPLVRTHDYHPYHAADRHAETDS